ncbi:MAG: ABC transporter permease [Gammaproteobacteria bacterium]|nr:ABC transporter permease [Gammaproteobacteria bacterium]
MNTTIQAISTAGLAISFVPAVLVVAILYRWCSTGGDAIYALVRMLIQLLLIGFVLVYIFAAENAWLILGVLSVMLVAASWIAMRPLRKKRPGLYLHAGVAILAGGGATLALVTQLVLDLQPWFMPQYVVPLAGMIFANSMNAVSLAGERFESDLAGGKDPDGSRAAALQAAMIPVINSLFAVGIVALPGMMTGQILSGVSPFIAAKYQIVVMCMIFGSAGLSAAIYLFMTEAMPPEDAATA